MIFFVRFKHSNSFFSIFFFLLSACTPKPHSQGSRVGEDPGNKIACTPAGYYCKWNRFLNIAYCSFSSRTECTWLLILWSVTTLYIEQLMAEIPEYTTVWFLCSSLLCNSKQNILSGEKLQAENYSLYLHPHSPSCHFALRCIQEQHDLFFIVESYTYSRCWEEKLSLNTFYIPDLYGGLYLNCQSPICLDLQYCATAGHCWPTFFFLFGQSVI